MIVNFTLSKCIPLVQQNWMASFYHKRPSWGLIPFIKLEIYFFGIKKEEMITTHSPIKKKGRGSVHSSHPCCRGMDQRLLNLLNIILHNVLTILLHHPQIFNLKTTYSCLTLVIPKTKLPCFRLVPDCVSKSTQLSECPNYTGGDSKDIRQHKFSITSW